MKTFSLPFMSNTKPKAPATKPHERFTFRKGKFTGESMIAVAETDAGLRYLDNLRDTAYPGSYLEICLESLFEERIYAERIDVLAQVHDYADYRDLHEDGVMKEYQNG